MGGDFGRHTLMDEVENGLRGFGEILYGVSVVGGGVSETYGIYGARTHSAWRYVALANV